MRTSIRSITLLAGLLSACAATPALAQTKDQTHVAQELARLNPVSAALARYCKTTKPASYVCGAPRDSLARAIATASPRSRRRTSRQRRHRANSAPAPTPLRRLHLRQLQRPPLGRRLRPSRLPSRRRRLSRFRRPAPSSASAFPVPSGLGLNIAQVAELPRDTAPTPYPAITRQVRVSLFANLQAALNAAQPGDELLLPAGAAYTGDFMLPKHAGADVASCSSWIVVRTDVPDSLLGAPGVRMTPTRAAALKLAKIQTPDNQQAIGSAWGVDNVGCWRIVGLEMLPGPTATTSTGWCASAITTRPTRRSRRTTSCSIALCARLVNAESEERDDHAARPGASLRAHELAVERRRRFVARVLPRRQWRHAGGPLVRRDRPDPLLEQPPERRDRSADARRRVGGSPVRCRATSRSTGT
jgi:hypothetical protein